MCSPSSLGVPLRSSLIEKIRRLGREVRLAQNRENIFDCLQKKTKKFSFLRKKTRSDKIGGGTRPNESAWAARPPENYRKAAPPGVTGPDKVPFLCELRVSVNKRKLAQREREREGSAY